MNLPETITEITFRSDTRHRKQWFTGLSFSHPAKMVLPLQLYLIDRYTKEGDVILDPMAGSGTILVACSMGRHVITCELEDKFIQMQKGNWQKIQQRGPQMGCQMGTAIILQGDSRKLDSMLADVVMTSPPYGELANEKKNIKSNVSREERLRRAGYKTESYMGGSGRNCAIEEGLRYSHSSDNIGNLKSESYLQAMYEVYCQCHKCLKPDGLLILVLKNFIRNRQIIRLDLDTIALCEKAGFQLKERLARRLTQQSFWRQIYKQKYPEVEEITHEDILVLEKI